MNWKDIPGWTCADMEQLYSHVVLRPEAMFREGPASLVEVGVAFGRSLALLATLAHGGQFRVYGVDTFHEHMGGDNLPPDVFARMRSLGTPYQTCRNNLNACGLDDVELLTMPSVEAATKFSDGSLDFVFIDADHRYECVRADIRAWLPKVRPGGLLAGHDYSLKDFPGVVQAVEEAFGSKRRLLEGRVWSHEVPS